MDMEGHNMSMGWPLGLEIVNSRLAVNESPRASSIGPGSLFPSTSFSSFSSSRLDSESSASFFRDGSKSLGRLIGIRPGTRGQLYFPGSKGHEDSEFRPIRGTRSDISRKRRAKASKRICIPLLLNIMLRLNRKKNKSAR